MRPADVSAAIEAQAAEGIHHVIVNLPDTHRRDHLALLGGEVIPRAAEMRVTA